MLTIEFDHVIHQFFIHNTTQLSFRCIIDEATTLGLIVTNFDLIESYGPLHQNLRFNQQQISSLNFNSILSIWINWKTNFDSFIMTSITKHNPESVQLIGTPILTLLHKFWLLFFGCWSTKIIKQVIFLNSFPNRIKCNDRLSNQTIKLNSIKYKNTNWSISLNLLYRSKKRWSKRTWLMNR